MAKDIFHYDVKEGWNVVKDPFIIKSKKLNARLEVDLALEKAITSWIS
ncbi:MAG: element excision factor XisH family protein [Saprospiraceae bacterium]